MEIRTTRNRTIIVIELAANIMGACYITHAHGARHLGWYIYTADTVHEIDGSWHHRGLPLVTDNRTDEELATQTLQEVYNHYVLQLQP